MLSNNLKGVGFFLYTKGKLNTKKIKRGKAISLASSNIRGWRSVGAVSRMELEKESEWPRLAKQSAHVFVSWKIWARENLPFPEL